MNLMVCAHEPAAGDTAKLAMLSTKEHNEAQTLHTRARLMANPPKMLTTEMKIRAVELARKGLAMEHIAHALSMSHQTFRLLRNADPDFNGAVYQAFADYALSVQERVASASEHGEATGWQQVLARRFPAQYGNDPRLRDVNAERYDSDTTPNDTDTQNPGSLLLEAVNAMLNQREGGKE